jgi:hypothetical protein
MMTKMALNAAGEIDSIPAQKKTRERFAHQ